MLVSQGEPGINSETSLPGKSQWKKSHWVQREETLGASKNVFFQKIMEAADNQKRI